MREVEGADDIAWHIERERRALLLLAKNQASREQIEAAGRHMKGLGRLLKQKEAAAGPKSAPAAQPKSA